MEHKHTQVLPFQVELVKDSWNVVTSSHLEMFLDEFYPRLFKQNPEYRPLFKGDIKEQQHLLTKIFTRMANHAEKIKTLIPQLIRLGQRHIQYKVKKEMFVPFRNAFTWTLAMVLKEAFTDDLRAAWVSVFDAFSFYMILGLDGEDAEKYVSDKSTISSSSSSSSQKSMSTVCSSLSTSSMSSQPKENSKRKKDCVMQ